MRSQADKAPVPKGHGGCRHCEVMRYPIRAIHGAVDKWFPSCGIYSATTGDKGSCTIGQKGKPGVVAKIIGVVGSLCPMERVGGTPDQCMLDEQSARGRFGIAAG